MKKLMKSLMLFAVAAMAFNSCENEGVNESFSNDGTVTMTFVAGAPESRTSVAIDGDAANYSWSAGDKVGFYYVAVGADYKKKTNSKEAVIASDGTATFKVDFEPSADATSYNVGAFYPGMSWVSHADANPFNNVKMQIPATQNLVAGSFDPAADLMMSKPFMGIALDSETTKTLEFSRIAAIGKMNLKLTGMVAGEVIKSVKFSFAEGTHFNGPVVLNLENSTYELATANTSNMVTLTGSLEANAAGTPVFFTCFPGDYSGAYTIEVATDKANYSKEGTLSKALSFTAGNVLGFNAIVGNREEVAEDLYNYEGEYVIVAKRSSGNFFYMTPDLGTASTKRFTALDTGSSTVDGVAINEDYVWTVAKSGAAYTMQAPDGKYVTWTTGNSANLGDTGKALNIEKVEGQEYFKVSLVSDTSRILSLNSDAQYNYFAFYGNTNQRHQLYLIPVIPADPNAPSLSVAETTVELESGACDDTIAVTAKNIEGSVSCEVTSGSDWFDAYITTEGDLAYKASANDGEARTATVTLSAAGVEDVVVTFNQAANQSTMPGTGAGTEASPYDIARAYAVIDAANGGTVSGVYVKGIITEDAISFSSQYGNSDYYISNDGTTTNKLQVFRGKYLNNVAFTSADQIHAGDEVVIYGNLKKYYEKYEFDAGNYIVSLNCPHGENSTEQTVTFDYKPATVTVGKTATVVATAKTTVTYSSSNTAVATIDANTGVITGVAEGTVTITATAAAEGIYKQATATFELTVEAAQEGGTVTLGESYTYTFSSKVFAALGETKALGSLNWTVNGTGSTYFGNIDNNNGRGLQFGSKNSPFTSLSLTTTEYQGGVQTIKINTSGASGIVAKFTVTVGGVVIGSAQSLTTSAKEYTLTSTEMLSGDIVISYTATTGKAIYIKSISIN